MRILLNTLLAVALSVWGGLSQAQEAAQQIARAPNLPDRFHSCYRIDAQKEWQRVAIQGDLRPSVMVLSTLTGTEGLLNSLTPPYRWSVDDARYARVGPEGHIGSAAQALEPFSGFKYLKSEPFGALIIRANQVDPRAFPLIAGSSRFPEGTRWIDFRINDTGLGDNGGSLQLCVAQGS